MTSAQREAAEIASDDALDRVWGDRFDTYLDLANDLLRYLDERRPGMRQYLQDLGAYSNPVILQMLASHAWKLASRVDPELLR